jgi:lipid II:glycine glycyltransferase (peptidoglycan interpeptide bridge formation enzyme)
MTFRDLTAETAKRKLAAGISFPETGDRNYFELLKTMLIDTGIGRLYLTYDGCVPIAGAFIVGYNRTAYYLLSSTSEDGQRKGAQDLNIWTAITEFMNEGYKFFYLGGLSQTELVDQQLEKSGLYLFKKRFAAEIYPCYKGSLILRPAHRQIYEFIRKTKEVFVK